jgi:hypothetical protein
MRGRLSLGDEAIFGREMMRINRSESIDSLAFTAAVTIASPLVLASRVHEPGTICEACSADCVSRLTRIPRVSRCKGLTWGRGALLCQAERQIIRIGIRGVGAGNPEQFPTPTVFGTGELVHSQTCERSGSVLQRNTVGDRCDHGILTHGNLQSFDASVLPQAEPRSARLFRCRP